MINTLKRLALGIAAILLVMSTVWALFSAIGWVGNEAISQLGWSRSNFQTGITDMFGHGLWIDGVDYLLTALFLACCVVFVCGVVFAVPYNVGGAVQSWLSSRRNASET